VRIPLKAISHSGGKPITIPGENRSGVGAKRRWHFDVAKTDRDRQVDFYPERSEGWMVVARMGVRGKGRQSLAPLSAGATQLCI
jgi:hypothetical protein